MIGALLLVVLLCSVALVLVLGVVLMGMGNKANEKYGNKLMVARVSLQGLALLTLMLLFAGGGGN